MEIEAREKRKKSLSGLEWSCEGEWKMGDVKWERGE